MIQSGDIFRELLVTIPQAIFLAGKETLKRYIISTKINTKISWKSNRILRE